MTIFLNCLIYAAGPEDYFGVQAILYSSADCLSAIKGYNIYPREIANAVKFDKNSGKGIDGWIRVIAQTYDLDLLCVNFNNKNSSEITNYFESLNTPVIITYKKGGREHSAIISGVSKNENGETQSYLLNDSALDSNDNLDAGTLESEYWKLPVNNVYWFTVKTNMPSSLPEESLFIKYLSASRMLFRTNTNFIETPVIENHDMVYQYALKLKDKKLEVRYSFFPYSMDKSAPVSSKNNESKAFGDIVALNIAGNDNNVLKKSEFKPVEAKNEYFADWGAVYLVKCGTKYGSGYTLAMIVFLHKDNVADACEVFLFDSLQDVLKEFESQYYSVVFK